MRKVLAVAVAAVVSAVVTAAAAPVPGAPRSARDVPAVPLEVTGGTTEFTLTESARTELSAHGIRVDPVTPAQPLRSGDGVSLTVTTGSLTPMPFDGTLTYDSGGLRFIDDDGRKIEFTESRADLKDGTASAVLNGAATRIPLGTYTIDPAKVWIDSATNAAFVGSDIKLSVEAATAVNETFGQRIFEPGDAVFGHKSALITARIAR
ncbi:hypothetical protein [Streptomyces sp. NPDC002851]